MFISCSGKRMSIVLSSARNFVACLECFVPFCIIWVNISNTCSFGVYSVLFPWNESKVYWMMTAVVLNRCILSLNFLPDHPILCVPNKVLYDILMSIILYICQNRADEIRWTKRGACDLSVYCFIWMILQFSIFLGFYWILLL